MIERKEPPAPDIANHHPREIMWCRHYPNGRGAWPRPFLCPLAAQEADAHQALDSFRWEKRP